MHQEEHREVCYHAEHHCLCVCGVSLHEHRELEVVAHLHRAHCEVEHCCEPHRQVECAQRERLPKQEEQAINKEEHPLLAITIYFTVHDNGVT